MTLDGVLAAEGAGVAGVLRDFDLLHLLTEGGAVTVVRTQQMLPVWSLSSLGNREGQGGFVGSSAGRERTVFL